MSRSNTHRTLATLMHAGYARRNAATGTYGITMKSLALGLSDMALDGLQQVAPGFLATLAHASGETAHLSELRGSEVCYLDKIDSRQPVRAYSEIGGFAPAHAVATGKALLSAQANVLAALPATLPRYTANTRVDRQALRAELEAAARNGYATNRGEWREGVGGLAAVVRDAGGKPVAALGLSGPLDRLTDERLRALVPLVMDLAQRLSETLRHLADIPSATATDAGR
ncbi:MAG: IclR family transcriptional regulator [Gammaproteobacteria bacterium]